MNQFRVTFLNPQLLIGMDVRDASVRPSGHKTLIVLAMVSLPKPI